MKKKLNEKFVFQQYKKINIYNNFEKNECTLFQYTRNKINLKFEEKIERNINRIANFRNSLQLVNFSYIFFKFDKFLLLFSSQL